MTPAAIREAFESLRSDDEMMPLADAARSRSEADWLVGINGTRAMTAFNSKEGGFYLTTVGRVQTPTLAIVAEREDQIRRFEPRNYWEVRATFDARAGRYEGRWFDEAFKKGADPDARYGDGNDCRPDVYSTLAHADALAGAEPNSAGAHGDHGRHQHAAGDGHGNRGGSGN